MSCPDSNCCQQQVPPSGTFCGNIYNLPSQNMTSCSDVGQADIRPQQDSVKNWPNMAKLTMPITKVNHTYAHGLADLQTPIPKSFSWLGTNEVEDGWRNQLMCGCCWSMSVASVLSDRYAIKYGMVNPKLSNTWLMMCANNPMSISISDLQNSGQHNTNNFQCLCGGNTYLAGKFLEEKGTKLESCWPFSQVIKFNEACKNENGQTPECPTSWSDNACYNCTTNDSSTLSSTFRAEKDSTQYIVAIDNDGSVNTERTTSAIQREIMIGPVTTSFQVPSTFMYWWSNNSKDDIYIPDTTDSEGGHAVALVGWGEDMVNGKNIRYWIMRNSWGYTHDGVGWCKFAFSLDTPKEYWTLIDTPGKSLGLTWEGGVVTFKAGDLPEGWVKEKSDGKRKPIGTGPRDLDKSNGSNGIDKNTLFIAFGILAVIVIILVLILK